jgi:5-(carboxyamino)imidazole ribonucleotide synthase
VYNFGKVDVLTFEIEFQFEALLKLENEGLKIYPSPKTLKLIQNKGIQKIFLFRARYSNSQIQTI